MISSVCPLLVEADMTNAVAVGAAMFANSAKRRLRGLSWRKLPTAGYGPFLTDGIRQLLMEQRTFSKHRTAISGGTPSS
jgi:hypothetical protein